MIPSEVFLSHSSQDRAFATALAETMRQHGVPVWYSPTNILGAQQWQEEIGAALRRCDWFVIILSPNALSSLWVKRELSYALQERRFDRKISPLVLVPGDYTSLSWTLPQFQMIRYDEDIHAGHRELFRTWGIGYKLKT
jgi:hypothetical protein